MLIKQLTLFGMHKGVAPGSKKGEGQLTHFFYLDTTTTLLVGAYGKLFENKNASHIAGKASKEKKK